MFKNTNIVNVILLLVVNKCCCHNVLVVFPAPYKSDGVLGDGYVRNLLEDGLQVTYITANPWKTPPDNLIQIDVSSNIAEWESGVHQNLSDTYYARFKFVLMRAYTYGAMTVNHPDVQAFLRDPKLQFDVVIAEWADSEIYSAFAVFFKCPLIWAVSTQMFWQPIRLMDEYSSPAYTVDIYSGYMPPINFVRRLKELNAQVYKGTYIHYKISSLESDLYNKAFETAAIVRGVMLPKYNQIKYNYSMMLVNSHPSVASSWKLPPSIREIAGYHIKTPVEELDAELKSVLDKSNLGVIYFSMDSTLSGSPISTAIRDELLKLFEELMLTVIWRTDITFISLQDNIHVMSWVPQAAILNHTNTKVFISHGSMLSTIEAVHFGVPVIGIPHRDDQFNNIDALDKKGIAIKVDYYDSNLPEKLKEALKKILADPRYMKNAKNVSSIYHDRLTSPGDELRYWVKHVISTHGATYLRSPAFDVPVYQKTYLDLVALILLVILVAGILIVLAVRWCLRKMRNIVCCCNCRKRF